MDPEEVIEEIADRADDFLAGAENRAQARAGIEELITADYPQLKGSERAMVVNGVMSLLDEEGFFDAEPGTDPAIGEGDL